MGEVKRWNEDITTPGVDSPSECGGGLDRPTRSYPDVYNPPGNYETIPEHENESASKYSYDLDSPYDLPTNYVAQFLFYTTPSVIESVAVDKGVAVLYSVVCEDPSVLIETEKGTETLKTKIQLRVSLKYDCVVPDTSEEEGNVTCNYWGPLPIPGPPAGTCPLDCPKCNMCVPKDPSNQFSTDPDDYECIAYAQGIETIFPEIPASLCPDNKCMTCDPATARPDPAGTGYDIMDCTLPYYGYQDKDCAKCEICIEDPTGACGSVDDAIALGQPAGVVSQIRTAINQISDTDCPGDCEGCDDDGSCGLGPPSIGAWDCGNACQTCTANNVCSVHSSQADNECDGTKCAKCGTDGSCGEYFNDGKRHNCPACNSCQGTADCVFDASMGGCGTCDMCDATVGGCAPNPAKLGDKCGSKECYEMRCANNGCTDKRVFEGKICGNNPQCRGRCDSSGDCDASANDGQSCDYCGENPDAGSCDNGYCKLDKLCCQGNICAGGSDTYKCCGPACYLKSKGACPDVT